MKKNMGVADQVIRLIVAVTLVILYMTNIVSRTIGIILLVIAGIFALTSLAGSCPLYTILGINTCKRKTA